MLNYFEWQLPTKVIFGEGSIYKAGRQIKAMGKSCFLVTGKHSAEKQGYLKIIKDQLLAEKINFYHFNKISPNPKTIEIDEAAEIVRQDKYDFILALGGG
ncbi:MAG: iron-containing alcohol dehydrogenase [Candidatus Margulisbacteria bacterium]|nr:iron-containing alcohol dehydrogenase [Candidatus Margulisiibacteriota bacterium]